MIIPVQREGATNATFSEVPVSQTKSSSTYTSKKSVRITPKITEVEIKYPTRQPQPVASSLNTDFTTFPKPNWVGFSALQEFDANNKRLARDDIESFLLPSLTSRSFLKDKFDNFTNQIVSPIFHEHPIKIDCFTAEADKYVLILQVNPFKSEELVVKVTDDTISITGKHEEKQDERNFSCQEYSRTLTLPVGVKADDVKCRFSADGVLTITAPRKVQQPALELASRTIPIQHGMSAIRV